MFLRYVILFCLLGGVSCGASKDQSTKNIPLPVTNEYTRHDTKSTKQAKQAVDVFVYKSVGAINLKLNVYQPTPSNGSKDKQTVIVFFHGGAWTGGAPMQFQRQALYLAGHGIVSITAEYRLKKTHGTTPIEAVSDAKSVIRWVRGHALDLRIDPNKIIAAGASAGGQLAIATAIIDQNNDPVDNLTISAIPNALVLFNPVLDMQKWEHKFGISLLAISPLQQLHRPLPPTIIFHGTNDNIAPYSTTVEFVNKALSIKSSDVRLVSYQNKGHSFFNKDLGEDSDFKSTLKETYNFIVGLGW